MVMLGEEQSFSLTANVTSPGYIRTVLRGFLVSKRNGETWIAPLIPQLFYGADGNQLSTWRQNISTAGSQVILSRKAGGYPEVPREELWWRKVKDEEEVEAAPKQIPRPTLLDQFNVLPWHMKMLIVMGGISVFGVSAYFVAKAFKR